MSRMIVLHNPHDVVSVDFLKHLNETSTEYCLLNWYNPAQGHPKAAQEAVRLYHMVVTGVLDGGKAIPPMIGYSEEEIQRGDYPHEHGRWMMQCECHFGEPYAGPCPRAFPSVIMELDDGRLGLWDTPETIQDLVPEKMRDSVALGECIGGQWLEGAMATAQCPYFSNAIIKTAVAQYVKKYCTLTIPAERDKVLVELPRKDVQIEPRSLIL